MKIFYKAHGIRAHVYDHDFKKTNGVVLSVAKCGQSEIKGRDSMNEGKITCIRCLAKMAKEAEHD